MKQLKQTLSILLVMTLLLGLLPILAVSAETVIQTVTVSNNAHWEGYTTTQGGSVNDSSYQYEAGGTAGSMTTPQIKIHKIDQYNNQLNLKGAEFSLTKMKLENNQLQEDTYPISPVSPSKSRNLVLSIPTQSS